MRATPAEVHNEWDGEGRNSHNIEEAFRQLDTADGGLQKCTGAKQRVWQLVPSLSALPLRKKKDIK